MLHPLLAQNTMELPVTDSMKTLIGLIGVMVLGITVMTFWLLAVRVFGAKPPLDKQIEKLRREIYEINGATKKSLRSDIHAQGQRIDGIENDIEEIKIDRERKWQMLTKEYHELDLKITTLTERVSNVLKRLESTL